MKALSNFIAVLLCLSSFSLAASDEVSPMTVEGAMTVDAMKAKELFDNEVAFIDVRKNSDWEAGRIPSAIHLELKKVLSEDSLLEEVSKDDPVVFYCNGEKCLRSSQASKMAVDWGFKKVFYFRDGFPAWKSAGYPVE